MPTRKFLQRFVLTMMPSAILWLPAQSSQNVPGIALDQLELHNMKAEAVNYNGKPAVRVDALPDAANGADVRRWGSASLSDRQRYEAWRFGGRGGPVRRVRHGRLLRQS